MPIDKDNEVIDEKVDEKVNEQVEDTPTDVESEEIGATPEGTGQEPAVGESSEVEEPSNSIPEESNEDNGDQA